MNQEKEHPLVRVTAAIEKISLAEPEALESLAGLLEHIASTYKDKYAEAKKNGRYDTKEMDLYHLKRGIVINVYQAQRYLQRYDTEGFAKSGNVVDICKAIHYLTFELTRSARANSQGEVSDSKVSN